MTTTPTVSTSASKPSKTKTSFYRRLYITYLIDQGINNVPAITEATGMPRRTAQDTILALGELGVEIDFIGGTKNGYYQLKNWGAINPQWVNENLDELRGVLGY